jgi:hypothetical protein
LFIPTNSNPREVNLLRTERSWLVNAGETVLFYILGTVDLVLRAAERFHVKFPHLHTHLSTGNIVLYLAIFLMGAAPAAYLGSGGLPAFNSPDEANAYTTANLFAEHGRLYFQDEMTAMELDGLKTVPRTFVQKNGRGASQYPLAHPLFLGIFHKTFGGASLVLIAIVPGLLALTLALLLRVLLPAAPGYLSFVFIGTAPLWYWISRVYMNLALELLFVAVGLLCLAIALRRKSLVWFFAGSSGFALGALVRHPEAPMLLIFGIAFIVAMARCYSPFHWGHGARLVGVYLFPQVFLFLLPVGLLSWWTYGTPLTIGYLALYENHYTGRLPDEGIGLLDPLRYLKLLFFPNPIDMGTLWLGLRYQLFMMVPIIVGLGTAGILMARHSLTRTFGYAGLFLLVLGLVYALVSRADPGVFGASATAPQIHTSIVRYWQPIYVALGIGAAYALYRAPKLLSLPLILVLVAVSINHVWNVGPEPVVGLKNLSERQVRAYRQVLEAHTEPDAFVFAVGRIDKYTVLSRRTAAVWLDPPNEVDVQQVADVATSVGRLGRPVYLVSSKSGVVSLEEASNRLVTDSLRVQPIPLETSNIELVKLEVLPAPLKMLSVSHGVYGTRVTAPDGDFAIMIEWDGTTNNYIGNPSIEGGMEGWEGPAVGSRVTRTNKESFFGQFSLKLELAPGLVNEEFVRSTYSLDAKEIEKESWLAFGRIMATGMSEARASMRVIIKDKDWVTIDRHEMVINGNTNGFETIGLGSEMLVPNANTFLLQLGLEGLTRNSAGTVYWDGIELFSGTPLPGRLCHAGDEGCSFVGGSHLSSGRVSPIEAITLKVDDESEIEVNGPFHANDRLLFQGDQIILERRNSDEIYLASFPRILEDQNLELQALSISMPRMRLIPIN